MGMHTNVFAKLFYTGKYNFTFFCIVLIVLTTIMVYINRPLYLGHDTSVHYARIEALMTAMQDGRFPWYINYNGLEGFGYFIKAFYCDVLFIPFAILGLFSSALFAYKSILVVSTLLCGLLTYWGVNRVFKDYNTAFLSAILFTFCSYRILDLYQRGAIGEMVSFTILPVILVGGYELIKGDYRKWYILTIGFSLLIFNHVLSTILTLIVFVIFVLIYIKPLLKEPKRIFHLIIAGAVTILITAYYTIPMAEQMMSNEFYYQKYPAVVNLANFAVKLNETIAGMVNMITPDPQIFHIKIGSLLLFGIVCRIFIREKGKVIRTMDILSIVGILLIFTSSKLFPWTSFPFNKIAIIQFPWRFIEFSSFLLAISGAYYLTRLTRSVAQKMALVGIISICTIVILSSENKNFIYNAQNSKGVHTMDEYLNQDTMAIYGGNEYIPGRVNPDYNYLKNRKGITECNDSNTIIIDYKREKSITKLEIQVNQSDSIELPMFYYQGYVASLNGDDIPLKQSKNGMILLPINESGMVEVYYKGTTIQWLSTFVSLLSILLLGVYIYLFKRKIKTNAK